MNRDLNSIIFLLTVVVLAACGGVTATAPTTFSPVAPTASTTKSPSSTPTASAAPTRTSTATSTRLPTRTPSATSTRSPTPSPSATYTVPLTTRPADAGPLLSAPLYFISGADRQIWRIERDGETLTQITHEPAPVTALDVSLVSGDLAYVSNNDLIRADATGGARRVLFDGPEYNPKAENWIVLRVSNPYWSPDGARLSFGYDGVNTISAGSGQPEVIMQSDPYPSISQPPTQALVRFFLQGIWSPDGTKLLIEYAMYPEGGGWLVNSLVEGVPAQELLLDCGCYIVAPAWSSDSQHLYLANDGSSFGIPGLWRADSLSGATETLSADETGAFDNLFSSPHQAADGSLYLFHGNEADSSGGPSRLTLSHANADGSGSRPLRSDTHQVAEALWAADGSGAVIVEFDPNNQAYPYHGPLVWLEAVNVPAVKLPADGFNLRWGASQ